MATSPLGQFPTILPASLWQSHVLSHLTCNEVTCFGLGNKDTLKLTQTPPGSASFWEIRYKNKFGKEVPSHVQNKDCYARMHLLIDENLKLGRIFASKERTFGYPIHLVKVNQKNFPTHWLYQDSHFQRWMMVNNYTTHHFAKVVEEEQLSSECWSLEKDISLLPVDAPLSECDPIISAEEVAYVVEDKQIEKMKERCQAFIGGGPDGSIHVRLFYDNYSESGPTNGPLKKLVSLVFQAHTANTIIQSLAFGDGYFFSSATNGSLKRHRIKIFRTENEQILPMPPESESLQIPSGDDLGFFTHLVVKAGKLFAGGTAPLLYVWDIETSSLTNRIELLDKNFVDKAGDLFMDALCITEDRLFVAIGLTASSQKLQARDLNTLKLLKEISGPITPEMECLSSYGPTLFSGHRDGHIYAWNHNLDPLFIFSRPNDYSKVEELHIKEGVLLAKYKCEHETTKTMIQFWPLSLSLKENLKQYIKSAKPPAFIAQRLLGEDKPSKRHKTQAQATSEIKHEP